MQTRAEPEHQTEFQHSAERGASEASRLRLALDTIPAMVHSAQPDGSCDYFNQRWLDYLGVSLDDIKGWKWTSRIHPEDADAFVEKFRSSIRVGEPFEAEARVRRHDGVYRWMLHRKVPLHDEQGKVIGWYGSSTDIDELKRSKFYITEGERLSHVGSWAFTPGGFDHWSSELFRIHGLNPSAKAPSLEEYLQLVHPEDREYVSQTIQKMFAEGRGFDYTKRIVRPDGEIRRVRCVGVPSTHGGTSQGFLGTGIDVTEQERTLDELKRSEFYLAEGQRLGHAGSWSFKPDLTCDYWSHELYEILGFDPRNGIPTISDYFTRIHPQDREVVEATIRRMVAAGEGCDLKKRIIRPDGVQRVIRCVGMAVREKGVVTRFVGTLMDITEQEELTQELRRREAYLAEAQRLSHTGSFSWNVVTDELTWSDELYRIKGYDRSIKPTFEAVRNRVHPEDRQLWQDAYEKAAQGREIDIKHRVLMPDGSVKFMHVVAYGIQKDGKFVELVGTVRDITELKRAEETLRRSQHYLAEAQKVSHTGSWAWSPVSNTILYWSEECYRISGYDPAQGLPSFESSFQRIHPEDQPIVAETIERAVREKAEFQIEYRQALPDGTRRNIRILSHPVLDASGKLVEFIGTVMDVTEQKRAEEELRASEQKYRHLVDTTPAFVHTGLPGGDLDFFNRGWLEYLGLSITDLTGWRWTSAIHPEDVEELVAKWRAALESGKSLVAEARVRRADGKYRWFLHRKQPQRNEAGEIIKWYGSSIEIEERKIAEEALRRRKMFLEEGQRLSHTGSWGWNASTGKLTWSQEHFRILGLDPQNTNPSLEVFWERVHPDDRIGAQRTFESAIRDKRDFEKEFRIVTPDWSIRHLHAVGHVILNKANQLAEFIGSTMDITERKRAEERAQSQREAIRLALNAFVEELDVNLFLSDVIAELNKQFHAKSWELWLFDETLSALELHSSSHPTEYFRHAIGSKNARPLEELLGIWPIKDAARAPQILDVSSQKSLSRRHGESLTRRGIKTLMIVPLVLGEQNLGFLELHFQSQTQFSSDDLELAQALVNHATLALQLHRLTRRAKRLAVTEERNRLAREIHDTLAQAFAGIVLHSEALGASLAVSKQRCAKALAQIQKLARTGLEEARRSVQALRPKALDDNTLPEALRQAAIRLNDDAKLSCQFRQRGKKIHLSGEIQNELFRIGQEALTNVVKHAQAKSVYITLVSQARRVALSIKDDGVGFATAKPKNQSHGFGMGTMRERAQGIGGRLCVESRPGRGTTIRVEVPLSANRSKKKVQKTK